MRMARSKSTKAGKLSLADMRALINKKAGINVAHNLTEENPTQVKDWIPTGSRWLDSIICRGKLSGIPMGKIVEIAGLEATGKSYMAAQVAANAQKMGIDVIYFDSESAIDPAFLERAVLLPSLCIGFLEIPGHFLRSFGSTYLPGGLLCLPLH